MIITGIAVVIGGLILGAVTNTLARQLGGDGVLGSRPWASSMLIISLTDAPRLVFALFLGGGTPSCRSSAGSPGSPAAALFTSMVSKSHDLPWPKALGASSIQLIALL